MTDLRDRAAWETGPVYCVSIETQTGVMHKPRGLADRPRHPRSCSIELLAGEEIILVTSPRSTEHAEEHALAWREAWLKDREKTKA